MEQAYLNPYRYAQKCAFANPTEVNAILCVRKLVEGEGVAYRTAVAAVYAAFPLGITQLGKIAEEADRRYGGTLIEAVLA